MDGANGTTWHSSDGLAELRVGDCRAVMRQLPAASFHTCATSPPYFGLRTYEGASPSVWGGNSACDHEWGGKISHHNPTKHAYRESNGKHGYSPASAVIMADHGSFCAKCDAWHGCLGSEPTPELYVAHMVDVFREVKRVLRDDGTLWLNLGDSHANDAKWGGSTGGKHAKGLHGQTGVGREKKRTGVGPKNLIGIPWRVALALQSDGWTLRADIIWHKPNPMTSSAKDRPTISHEYLFLLSKQPRYFYDMDAIREPCESDGGSSFGKVDNIAGAIQNGAQARRCDRSDRERYIATGRNKRSVWRIGTASFKGAHFAVFPPRLVEPCILAGTSEKGCCATCGKPWVRLVNREFVPQSDVSNEKRQKGSNKGMDESNGWGGTPRGSIATATVGWRQDCKCEAPAIVPCRVLEPFCGSGTTLMVARWLGRASVGIELSETYARDIAQQRIETPRPAEKKPKAKRRRKHKRERTLF